MSPSTELISIIIPAYNSGLYIGRCLDSVTAAIDANCEVVVVNDGSTDDTAAIVRSYAERDRRIEFIELEKHIGPGAARKAGVDYAQGDSVLFMDADDTMPAKAIAELRSVNDPDADNAALDALYNMMVELGIYEKSGDSFLEKAFSFVLKTGSDAVNKIIGPKGFIDLAK